ncbi:hypothetical protein N8084_00885 [Pelagibacteraceae bacterium]|jgi:hypothetical protein|nr:hypothetical protein [Pelagibacteraceae bacterium]
MNYFFLKNWHKIVNKKKYKQLKLKENTEKKIKFYKLNIKNKIDTIHEKIKKNKKLNFIHSGHIGDLIYSLPVIKKLSETHECSFYIQKNKPINVDYPGHPSGNVLLDEKIIRKLLPLLKLQSYFKLVDIYNNEEIDVDLDLCREIPINVSFHQVRWYVHITGIHVNMEDAFLDVNPKKNFDSKVIILRTFRNRNHFIDYKFLSKYKNLLFVGLENEFNDLKNDVPNLEFYNCKDFHEMAQIIKASRFYLGNLSGGYSIAEGLKVPRLLEGCSDFPAVYPIGGNSFDFYHQSHLEFLFEQFYNKYN